MTPLRGETIAEENGKEEGKQCPPDVKCVTWRWGDCVGVTHHLLSHLFLHNCQSGELLLLFMSTGYDGRFLGNRWIGHYSLARCHWCTFSWLCCCVSLAVVIVSYIALVNSFKALTSHPASHPVGAFTRVLTCIIGQQRITRVRQRDRLRESNDIVCKG